MRHTDVSDLLQLLLTHFIADSCTRKLLALPAQVRYCSVLLPVLLALHDTFIAWLIEIS